TSAGPLRGKRVAAQAGTVIAGMGEYGTFAGAPLQRTMANVAQGIAALRLDAAATVLIGAGEGNLDEETALRIMLQGFGAGLLELKAEAPPDGIAFDTLWIVECDARRFLTLEAMLKSLGPVLRNQGVDVRVVESTANDRRRAAQAHERRCRESLAKLRAPAQSTARAFNEVRLTVEYDDDKQRFQFSALT